MLWVRLYLWITNGSCWTEAVCVQRKTVEQKFIISQSVIKWYLCSHHSLSPCLFLSSVLSHHTFLHFLLYHSSYCLFSFFSWLLIILFLFLFHHLLASDELSLYLPSSAAVKDDLAAIGVIDLLLLSSPRWLLDDVYVWIFRNKEGLHCGMGGTSARLCMETSLRQPDLHQRCRDTAVHQMSACD